MAFWQWMGLAVTAAVLCLLVRQQQHQISRDEVSLGIAREVLQFLPLPVIGLDEDGMIAFINAAAANLFERGAALLGNEAAIVLPQLFDGQGAPRLASPLRRYFSGAYFFTSTIHCGSSRVCPGSMPSASRRALCKSISRTIWLNALELASS